MPLESRKARISSACRASSVERKHLELQRIDEGYVLLRPPAFEHAMEQFMRYYRRDGYVAGVLQPYTLCWL
jgi:hypothetical protein